MTRENAKKLLPIIEAYANGKKIQSKTQEGNWYTIKNALFTDHDEYRIAPEPEYVPFDCQDAESVIGKTVYSLSNKWFYVISGAGSGGIHTSGFKYHITYREAFEKFTFLDGTPFGKLK